MAARTAQEEDMKVNLPVTGREHMLNPENFRFPRPDLKGIITFANSGFIEDERIQRIRTAGQKSQSGPPSGHAAGSVRRPGATLELGKPWTGVVRTAARMATTTGWWPTSPRSGRTARWWSTCRCAPFPTGRPWRHARRCMRASRDGEARGIAECIAAAVRTVSVACRFRGRKWSSAAWAPTVRRGGWCGSALADGPAGCCHGRRRPARRDDGGGRPAPMNSLRAHVRARADAMRATCLAVRRTRRPGRSRSTARTTGRHRRGDQDGSDQARLRHRRHASQRDRGRGQAHPPGAGRRAPT